MENGTFARNRTAQHRSTGSKPTSPLMIRQKYLLLLKWPRGILIYPGQKKNSQIPRMLLQMRFVPPLRTSQRVHDRKGVVLQTRRVQII